MTQETLVKTILNNKHLLSCKKDEIEIISSLHLTIKHNNEISPNCTFAIYGYGIRNTGETTLQILDYTGNLLIIEPEQEAYIPTNLLILLLLRIEYSLKTKNGDFISTDGDLDTYKFQGNDLIKESIGIEDLDTGKISIDKKFPLFKWLDNKSIF